MYTTYVQKRIHRYKLGILKIFFIHTYTLQFLNSEVHTYIPMKYLHYTYITVSKKTLNNFYSGNGSPSSAFLLTVARRFNLCITSQYTTFITHWRHLCRLRKISGKIRFLADFTWLIDSDQLHASDWPVLTDAGSLNGFDQLLPCLSDRLNNAGGLTDQLTMSF